MNFKKYFHASASWYDRKIFFIDQKIRNLKQSFYYNLDHIKDQKYDRVIFYLQNSQKLIYNDVRKFGFIKLYNQKKYEDIKHLINLGPELLKKDFNFEYFKIIFLDAKEP